MGTDDLDGSHGTIDQSHVDPQIGGKHDTSTHSKADDCFKTRGISDETFATFGPVCTALIVAMGWPTASQLQ